MLDLTSETMSLIQIMHRPKFILKIIVNVKNYIVIGFYSFFSFPSIFFLSFMVHIFKLVANYCARPITKPLCTIINDYFSSGVFQDRLKLAKVIPMYKKVQLMFHQIIDQFHCYFQ